VWVVLVRRKGSWSAYKEESGPGKGIAGIAGIGCCVSCVKIKS